MHCHWDFEERNAPSILRKRRGKKDGGGGCGSWLGYGGE